LCRKDEPALAAKKSFCAAGRSRHACQRKDYLDRVGIGTVSFLFPERAAGHLSRLSTFVERVRATLHERWLAVLAVVVCSDFRGV
jgi:hypothetical protein